MKVTHDLLVRLRACEHGLDLLKKYPDGATLIELANDPDTKLEDFYFARHYFCFNSEEMEVYNHHCQIERCGDHVLRSSQITDSNWIYNSTHVDKSSYINSCKNINTSFEIVNSVNVEGSKNTINSKNINYSDKVADSDNISNSNNVINSSYINWCNAINSSFLLDDC